MTGTARRRGPAGWGRWWVSGLLHPAATMRALPASGPPVAGLAAVLVRFAVQDLAETLPLAVLGRRPFLPTKLPIRPEHHYRVQVLFLPPFGLGAWLLMSAAAHGVLRLSGHRADLRRVLDVIGVGMLLPMPPLWAADAALIATNRFSMPALGFVNVPVQLWETALFGVGLHTALQVPRRHAAMAAAAASTLYVLGASTLLR